MLKPSCPLLTYFIKIIAVYSILCSPFLGLAQNSSTAIIETFERGSAKAAYATETADFETGKWVLEQALVGSLEGDLKRGAKSVRLKPQGRIYPLFAVQGDIEGIEFYAGLFSEKEALGIIQLEYSLDGGKTFKSPTKVVECKRHILEKAYFPFAHHGEIILRLTNKSAQNVRINIDDIQVIGKNLRLNKTISSVAEATEEPTNIVETPIKSLPTLPSDKEHLLLGNPSGAVPNVREYDNFLIARKEYALSYNKSKGTANWVAWRAAAEWNGDTKRSNDFRPDPNLPTSWYRASSDSYKNSGFDRGHLCSSGDRDKDAASNSTTFYMTNIVPQAPNNNQGAWHSLELYLREKVEQGNEIYTYAGVYGKGGEGKNGKASYIDGNAITVPAYIWKIALMLPNGKNDVSRINEKTEIVAVWMPNNQSVGKENWEDYRQTVAYIESKTGYTFFSSLPKSMQLLLRAKGK